MKLAESFDCSEGACTGGNFVGSGPGVKPHGAILGMQMQRNNGFGHSGAMRQHRTRNLEIPGSLRAPE
jgi:hypothetical protein